MTINENVKVILKRLMPVTHNIKLTRRSQNQNGSTKRVSSECRQYLGCAHGQARRKQKALLQHLNMIGEVLKLLYSLFVSGDTARRARTFSTNILNELEGSRLIKALKLELSLRHYFISLANPWNSLVHL